MAWEESLLEALLSHAFEGAIALRAQITHTRVTRERRSNLPDHTAAADHKMWLIELDVSRKGVAPAKLENTTPIEGTWRTPDGLVFTATLFTRDGYCAGIEVLIDVRGAGYADEEPAMGASVLETREPRESRPWPTSPLLSAYLQE